ncbi:hypothetical protein HLB44_08815 [Aquincola sp. S2]|uniref:Calcium-binding protein n=1 Tax=Pseudaquabacterium terrae TaxID=2732868 RepID=A0ABX2EEN3_9BURK|nr:calcium-binding protein [Aquabacterium terrae]NRF67080.1 hypothetical protein [Aquabacterium terrae]
MTATWLAMSMRSLGLMLRRNIIGRDAAAGHCGRTRALIDHKIDTSASRITPPGASPMAFHLYRLNELYSNPSGTIQFIELSIGGINGESFWQGVTLSTSSGGTTRNFTFPSHLPSSSTANTTVLIATSGFAELGIVTPDFIVPNGFLFTSGGTLNFGGADQITYPALPTDGVHAVNRVGVSVVATPRNFAGATGTLPPPGTPTFLGGDGNDTMTGSTGDELIDGQAGNDTIRGGGGNDTLKGGSGDDAVYSGVGNDAIDGGDGYDYLYFTDATAGVSINMAIGSAAGGAGSDTITGIELVFGSPFADTFVGNDAGIGFLGGEGNDTITGGSARDHLEGNGGDDVIDGLGGVDVVAYYSAAFAVNVDLTAQRATGGLGTDTLRNVEDAVGSVFGDTLKGSSGNNLLEGSDGNDSLVSTAGNDTLDGGLGIDTAVYAQARSAYTLQRSGGLFSIEKPSAAGSDALPNTERLQFSDTRLALDLQGHAGQTAKLLGAVFGAASVANKEYAGIGLSLLDGGMSYVDLAALAVAAAGKSSPADIVSLLWTNLFGAPPTSADAAPYVALLAGGSMSVGALTVLAADTSFNTANINLVGLAQTGLEYTA